MHANYIKMLNLLYPRGNNFKTIILCPEFLICPTPNMSLQVCICLITIKYDILIINCLLSSLCFSF